MSSIATVVRRFGAVVLVVGLLVGVSGFVLEETNGCEFGTHLSIHELSANETVEVGETRQYDSLSDREQRQFDDALADLRRSGEDYGSSGVYEDGTLALENGVVVHEGTRYEVSVFHSDCSGTGALPIILGAIGSAVGVLVTLVGSLWQWVGRSNA